MPPAICALEALLHRDWEMEVWRSYGAEMLRMINTALGAKKLPKFETLISEEDSGPAMTQEEVKEQRRRLLEKLNAG